MVASESRFVCRGCGETVPVDEPYPFRCPRQGSGDIDHVLRNEFDLMGEDPAEAFLDEQPNPFIRFRRFFHSYHVARSHGFDDRRYVNLVAALNEKIAAINGSGFRTTLSFPAQNLSTMLGMESEDAVWVKDETRNVSGSHKARHLMAVMIWLKMAREIGLIPEEEKRPLAIASCGNAALAAAIVAKAGEWPLHVFIPEKANPRIVQVLQDLGVHLNTCPRIKDRSGDPCYHAFRDFLASGAIPFTCQGNENALAIEGGKTLGYEMAAELFQQKVQLDHLFIQTGGGALAASTMQALQDAQQMAFLGKMPRIHCVQSKGAHPLHAAYEKVCEDILRRAAANHPETIPAFENPFTRTDFIACQVPRSILRAALDHAATHRSEYMRPWPETPWSLASGILDDETYDWLADVEGMLLSGGSSVVVEESYFMRAQVLAQDSTSIPVDPTGSAGLAGCMQCRDRGLVGSSASIGLLFTGISR